MSRIAAAIALAVLLVSGPWVQPVNAEPADPHRKIVVFQDGVDPGAARGVLQSHGAADVRQLEFVPVTAFSVVLPEVAVPALSRALGVLRVTPDYIVQAIGGPDVGASGAKAAASQPAETLPWGVNRIDADAVQAGGNKGAGINVAIIDTGIATNHPDLRVAGGRNFVFQKGRIDRNAYNDDNGHGSHVAGTVAALDNEIGAIGVAPDASLYAVKVLNSRGSGYLSDIYQGIGWAIDNGIQVINMSLGCDCDTPEFKQVVDRAYAAGIVVVAAAGNSGAGADTVIYPAKYDNAIAVAATDQNNQRASWSSTGPAVDIAAPGVSIYSTWKGTGYNTISGTSMASPHVAGTAALLLKAGTSDVRGRLLSTADPLGDPDWYGAGLVAADDAVAP